MEREPRRGNGIVGESKKEDACQSAHAGKLRRWRPGEYRTGADDEMFRGDRLAVAERQRVRFGEAGQHVVILPNP